MGKCANLITSEVTEKSRQHQKLLSRATGGICRATTNRCSIVRQRIDSPSLCWAAHLISYQMFTASVRSSQTVPNHETLGDVASMLVQSETVCGIRKNSLR